MSKPRVFVVEDDENVIKVLRHQLVQLGYEMSGRAANGGDALIAIPEVRPDVVLMDVDLPGELTGIETALRLREFYDTAIVVITGSSDGRTIDQAVEAGAFGYLVKPFESRDLHATLQAALGKHKVEQLLRWDKERLEAAVQQRTAELYASEARLRDIFDTTSDLIQSVAPDGRILYTNRAWRETLGYAAEDLPALNISDIIAPDWREHCDVVMGRLSEGPRPGLVELAFISRQGRRIEVEGSVNTAFEFGQPVSIRGIFRDVTERKAAEGALLRLNANLEEEVRRRSEKLVRSENELRLVWESALEAMRLTDADGIVRRVNGAYCRLVRQSRESLEGQPMSLPYAGEDHAKILAGHNRRFRERDFLARFETSVSLRDGTVLQLELANAFVSSAGEPELLLTVLRDVTARKRIEQSLRLTQFSVDRASDGVFWIEPDATIRYVNDSACRSLGLAREELVGKKVSDFDPNFPVATWPAHWAELKQKKSLTFEAAHRTNDGVRLYLEVTANFIEFEGEEYNCAFMRDISERKRAEQTLRASEQRLERVVNNIHDALIIDDTAGRVVFANKRFFEIFGRTEQPLATLTFDDYVAPEWREQLRDRHGRRIRGEAVPEHFEYEGLRGDGTRVWIDVSVARVVENGQVVGTQSAIRDITERKRAELSLLGANRRSSVLAQLGRELAEVDTPRSAALAILEGALQLLGWDASWLQLWNEQKRIFEESVNFDLIEGERREVPSNPYSLSHPSLAVRRAMQNGAYLHLRETEADEIQGCVLIGNGRRSLSRMFVAVRRGERLLGVLSIQSYQRDAYDRPALELLQSLADHCAGALVRIQARAALGESEKRFRGVFDASPIPILLSDASKGRLLEANAAALESFGYTREEIVGRTTAELGIWARPDQRMEFFRRLASGQAVQAFEATLRAKSGAERIMLCSGTVFEIAGRASILASAVDITAVRQAEVEKARIQERLFLSQKSEALGTLAGGVAHDFNNILTGVLNYTSLARSDCPPSHPRLRQFLDEVLKCGQRAKDLVRQILLFSRTEGTGRTPLLLQQVAREALSLLRATIPAAIEIKSDLDRAVPMVLANETQLHQVILNLGINAAQAMEERGGLLAIRVRQQIVDAALAAKIPDLQPGLHVCLEFTDTGLGMEPDVAARIFEPFFTTKKIGQGTGLGLAVVDSIVRSHQGAIRLKTRPGVGTTFELFFPAHGPGESVKETALGEIPRGRGQHILVVNDEAVISRSLQIMIERLGYRVTASTDPEEALACFWAFPDDFDLLIADYQMPGMTGIALAKRVFAHRPALPVLIASGFAGSMTVERMRREGIAEFLHKPIDSADLGMTLAKMLP